MANYNAQATHAPATHAGADTRPGADGDNPNAAPGHSFDDVELLRQRESERELLSQLRDPDRAQSENELWAIASENAGIRRELRRLGARRVEE